MSCPECHKDNKTNIDMKTEQFYSFERWKCDDCGCVWNWTCQQDVEKHGDLNG